VKILDLQTTFVNTKDVPKNTKEKLAQISFLKKGFHNWNLFINSRDIITDVQTS
jgi:hypothetical protein